MKTSSLWLIVVFAWLASSVWATDMLNLTPVKVRTPEDGLLHFVRSEAYCDHHPLFGREKILPVSHFANPQVLASFPGDLYEDDTADASLMVLFYGPGWDRLKNTPVLFVHGAGDDAFRSWVHPLSLTTPETIPMGKEGLLLQFAQAGYPTFAINFSHNHGCNYRQAEQIHNAIEIIRRKTGAAKVHLIAHSKGNCSASIYVCGGNALNPRYQDFLSPFGKDVDVYIQLAPGNKGIDVVFRYYAANLHVLQNKIASPVCFQNALYYGAWQNFYEEDIYKANPGEYEVGNYFPGQSQLAYDLVDDGLLFTTSSFTTFDLNLTMQACYYGGTTTVVSAYGIRHAIEEGDFTIERLNKTGIDPTVRLINIYGTDQVIQEVDFGWFKLPIGVSDYPSDGMVYVHSASYVKGLCTRGAPLLAQQNFKKNHFAVAFHPEVSQWLLAQLARGGNN
jgi:hypothetical protein